MHPFLIAQITFFPPLQPLNPIPTTLTPCFQVYPYCTKLTRTFIVLLHLDVTCHKLAATVCVSRALGCACSVWAVELSLTTSQRRGSLRRNKPADHAAKAEVINPCESRTVLGGRNAPRWYQPNKFALHLLTTYELRMNRITY